MHLDVDSAANLFSAQKKIESAFDRFRLIIVPESLTEFRVSCEQQHGCFGNEVALIVANKNNLQLQGFDSTVLKPCLLLYSGAHFGSCPGSSDDQ